MIDLSRVFEEGDQHHACVVVGLRRVSVVIGQYRVLLVPDRYRIWSDGHFGNAKVRDPHRFVVWVELLLLIEVVFWLEPVLD